MMTKQLYSNYQPRNGENTVRAFSRTGRFFNQKGSWFFKTREGFDYGPYDSRTECRYAYDEFIDVVSTKSELGGLNVDFEDTCSNWKMPRINFN